MSYAYRGGMKVRMGTDDAPIPALNSAARFIPAAVVNTAEKGKRDRLATDQARTSNPDAKIRPTGSVPVFRTERDRALGLHREAVRVGKTTYVRAIRTLDMGDDPLPASLLQYTTSDAAW